VSKHTHKSVSLSLLQEDCRGPSGLAMTDRGGFPAALVEKTKPIFEKSKRTQSQLKQGDTRNILDWTLAKNKPKQTQSMLAPSTAGG